MVSWFYIIIIIFCFACIYIIIAKGQLYGEINNNNNKTLIEHAHHIHKCKPGKPVDVDDDMFININNNIYIETCFIIEHYKLGDVSMMTMMMIYILED